MVDISSKSLNMINQMEKEFKYKDIFWKIIFKIISEEFIISLEQNNYYFQQKFNVQYLNSFEIFKNEKNIENIINIIINLIEEKKFEIKEVNKNINLVLLTNKNVELTIPKIEKNVKQIFDMLLNEIKLIKNEINELKGVDIRNYKNYKNEFHELNEKIDQLVINNEDLINEHKEVTKNKLKKGKFSPSKLKNKLHHEIIKCKINLNSNENIKLNEKSKNKTVLKNNEENNIICDFFIKKNDTNDNLIRQILNCYEEVKKQNPNWNWEIINGNENQKQIEENCEIYLNEEKICFSYIYHFPKEGKYTIKYKFKNNLTNTNFLFSKCTSIININLSNFNSNNVTNISGMFSYCSSLTSLDLSHFLTNNVTNMSCLFLGCSSLTSLNLSNFNTINATNMNRMFSYCSSLISLDLSNFNTSNVINMRSMFYNCSSLINLQISNFNTSHVTDTGCMFSCCSSLTSLNLYNFNINNVTDMSEMFSSCSSLTYLNISNFNTHKVTNMRRTFFGLNKNCKIISKDMKLFKIIFN